MSEPQIPKAKAIELLKNALKQIPDLNDESTSSPTFIRWQKSTLASISHLFGEDSRNFNDFKTVNYTPGMISWGGNNDQVFRNSFVRGLNHSEGLLEAIIDEIETHWPDDNSSDSSGQSPKDSMVISDRVFIVHGSDNETKQEVSRVVSDLGLNAIVLHEQPNKGRTLIDKFEQESGMVGYALVLLTPDDEGRKKGTEGPLIPRARQNVIFELGSFFSSLGRDRVCALLKGDVEIPSDYHGIVYIKMDDANWKLDLTKELKAAGYHVDANKLI